MLAGRNDRVCFEMYRGDRAREPAAEPLTADTLFDTASLTKPLITALMAAWFIQTEELSLHDPVQRFLPGFPRRGITLQHLATHTSGLPDWYPFYLERRPYRETLNHLDLQASPGRRVHYSCPGYILLAQILERVAGSDFISAATRLILDPLRRGDIFLRVPPDLRARCAPTEAGNRWERNLAKQRYPRLAAREFPWREAVIRGETHDCNSHYMGGSAGNAGLFATARALFRLSAEFLPQTATLLGAPTLRLLRCNLTPGGLSHRSFGFKINSTPLTSAGRHLPAAAFGHNGFTGTSIWLDPDSGMRYILLSNRVHPRVRKVNFNRIRRRLHQALVKHLEESGS